MIVGFENWNVFEFDGLESGYLNVHNPCGIFVAKPHRPANPAQKSSAARRSVRRPGKTKRKWRFDHFLNIQQRPFESIRGFSG
ncbi:MAG: hypothetical protein PHD57_09840 [Desulfobacterales bacterium]|jgi:hypothetical protein|nr:hypothetical protein [Desulfobacterales bacterium]MDD3081404.1 hypothetical protein [Desulfobacterales bacterium]MDD3951959.1 hypothetical protein [Desulfobacterales bacterium]MDD4463619.1 hypothetical protein [Desulfobacterales bacterium]